MQLTRRIVNGDMAFGAGIANFATGAESVAQNVVTRLRTFLGEWFLDTSFGTPWMQDIFVKPLNIPLAEADLKAIIQTTDGVDRIKSFSFVFNSAARTANVTASVTDVYGNVIGIQVSL